jgi:hypothetical protein
VHGSISTAAEFRRLCGGCWRREVLPVVLEERSAAGGVGEDMAIYRAAKGLN